MIKNGEIYDFYCNPVGALAQLKQDIPIGFHLTPVILNTKKHSTYIPNELSGDDIDDILQNIDNCFITIAFDIMNDMSSYKILLESFESKEFIEKYIFSDLFGNIINELSNSTIDIENLENLTHSFMDGDICTVEELINLLSKLENECDKIVYLLNNCEIKVRELVVEKLIGIGFGINNKYFLDSMDAPNKVIHLDDEKMLGIFKSRYGFTFYYPQGM